MKTYTKYEDIPNNWYLGSENGDGSMFEELDNLIREAKNPVRLRDDDGTYSYFDLVQGVTMILTVDFDAIIAHALETGASKYDYSFQFWEAFDELYPDVTQKYANILEEREATQ